MDVQYAKQAVKTIKKLDVSTKQRIRQELMLRLAPDDRATREDLIAHAAAINEYRLGETVSDKDIDWD